MKSSKEIQIKREKKVYKYKYKPIENVTDSDVKAAITIIKTLSEGMIRKVALGYRRNERVAKVLRELVIARQGAYTMVERINTEE
jgi:hypothetical protein